MFDRFRKKYPQGSITSSLIQIHNDRYIVSVSIKVDGVILATTLAADEQIQVAEAQATDQAIARIGAAPLADLSGASPPKTELETNHSSSVLAEDLATIEPDQARQRSNLSIDSPDAADIGEISEPAPPAAKSKKDQAAIVQENTESTAYQLAALSPEEPSLSVTDLIPLINMELKRLNWSREQGRDCIIELYNKRSSSLLSDDELLGLLRYLQSQPAPAA
jgi:hypothetical protein